MKRLAFRALLAAVYFLAAVATPPAYVYLATGVFAGFEGVASARYLLGLPLLAFSTLGLIALWSLWSFAWQAWTGELGQGRNKRSFGVLLAWAPLVGLLAIGEELYREEEIIAFVVFFAPSIVVATVVVTWRVLEGQSSFKGSHLADPRHILSRWLRIHLIDVPAIVFGIAMGILGFIVFVPRPRSGWGPCDWSIFFPFIDSVWPAERVVIFDSCSSHLLTLTFVCNSAALVCFAVGAFAAIVGKHDGHARGSWAAAIAIGCVLVQLLAKVASSADGPYIAWWPTIGVGALVIIGGAGLGYIGASMAAAWRSRYAQKNVKSNLPTSERT